MSHKKIVGTETELRLNCQGAEEIEEEHILPGLVVDNAFTGINGTCSNSLWMDKDNSELDDAITILKKNFSSGIAAIEEHLEVEKRTKNQIYGEESEKLLRTIHERQRFGFTGGYTQSGFRIYLDGTHPEVSTPECASPFDLVRWEKAGEKIIEVGRKKTEIACGKQIVLSKDNSDGFGNSWGAHENYLVDGQLFFKMVEYGHGRIVVNAVQNMWATFLVSRFVFCGSGKVGSEFDSSRRNQFLISQRAEFINYGITHSTTSIRGIINARNVPYVSHEFGRRFHVIIGDANMCEIPILLKTGTAMIMLMMLEDDFFHGRAFPIFTNLLGSLDKISSDITCREVHPVLLGDALVKMSALDIMRFFLDEALVWYKQHFIDNSGENWIGRILNLLGKILDGLAEKPLDLFGTLDWPTKYVLCSNFLDRRCKNWTDLSDEPELRRRLIGIAGAYHRLDDEGLYSRLKHAGKISRVLNDVDIDSACFVPPQDTRAFKRGELVRTLGERLRFVNWQGVGLSFPPYSISLDSPFLEEV